MTAEKYFLHMSFFLLTLSLTCRQMQGKRMGCSKDGELLNSHHQVLPDEGMIAVAKLTTVNIHNDFSIIQACALRIRAAN